MYSDQDQREFAREMRNQPTQAEKRLWWLLQAEKLGVEFRRQAAIGPYIVDFICFSHRLIVELDGPQHADASAVAHDVRRDQWIESRGFRVIRFRNLELDEDVRGVVERIKKALEDPLPSPPRKGREPERINDKGEGAGRG